MLELEAAQEKILSRVQPLKSETVPLSQAAGRFLARPVAALSDLPRFDNSAVDGYAVRAEDVAAASAENPVPLKVVGKIAAGGSASVELAPQTCVRLFTGSPLPRGADAVVMQEDTCAAQGDLVNVLDKAAPWSNVRLRAEDVKAGSMLSEPGERITAGHLALFAASGLVDVNVGCRPLVGLIATGSELREAGERLADGQIFESNRVALGALACQAGARTKFFPIIPDDPTQTEQVLGQALDECDAVVSAGGVSVGEFDFVKGAFERLGGDLEFWKVAIKPGKPFVFGCRSDKFLFGVPGNPVSALVTFLLLVRPALLRLQGGKEVGLPSHPGVLAEPISNRGDRRHFIRVRSDSQGAIRIAGMQASHVLNSLGQANGLIDVPPQTALQAGESVRVLRWQ